MYNLRLHTAVLWVVGVFFLSATAYSVKGEMPKLNLRDSAIFYASVAKYVHSNHVESTDYNELLDGALNGMLSALDPHSGYLTPKQYKHLQNQTQGKFSGLGVEVTMVDGLVAVVAPMDDTPAEKAGLQPGDLFVRINEKPVYGMTLMQAVDLLKGEPQTSVELTVRRVGGVDFKVTLTREIINVDPVKTRLEGNVGYIRIKTFNKLAASEVRAAVVEFKQKLGNKLAGIVLDVRNNAGGLLDQAIAVSDIFLDNKIIVSIRTRGSKKAQHLKGNTGDMTKDLPLVVLINAGSASASEILAAAIQDNKRGTVVGTKSFGKGSVQSVIPMKNGGAIKLTTALYYTPAGRAIQKKGVDPDIVIRQALNLTVLDESGRLREVHLNASVDPSIQGNRSPASAVIDKESKRPMVHANVKGKREKIKDYQLLRALDVLRGISLYRKANGKSTA